MTTPRAGQQSADLYSEQEAQQRFEKLVHVALRTPPKTQKSMGPKGVPAQSKKKRRGRKAA
jgi:hypothetical protein